MGQLDLFKKSGAKFSGDRVYRYQLWRIWDASKHLVMWIGLNPSTADETDNDPTIRRCLGFAKEWGYGGIYMTNLFAYRSPYPTTLAMVNDPIGELNDISLMQVAEICKMKIAAWGNVGKLLNRAKRVSAMIPNLNCLGKTKIGMPKHPLYLPKSTKIEVYM